jgi:hypothetical protein
LGQFSVALDDKVRTLESRLSADETIGETS